VKKAEVEAIRALREDNEFARLLQAEELNSMTAECLQLVFEICEAFPKSGQQGSYAPSDFADRFYCQLSVRQAPWLDVGRHPD